MLRSIIYRRPVQSTVLLAAVNCSYHSHLSMHQTYIKPAPPEVIFRIGSSRDRLDRGTTKHQRRQQQNAPMSKPCDSAVEAFRGTYLHSKASNGL